MRKHPFHNLAELRRLSQTGLSGGKIDTHRSLQRLKFPWTRLATMLILPVVFNLITWGLHDIISDTWLSIFAFWIGKLQLPAELTLRIVSIGTFNIGLPHIEIITKLPNAFIWLLISGMTAAILLVSFKLADAFLPLSYLLRFICMILASALTYCLLQPDTFPYSVTEYLDGALLSGVVLMLVIPWVHTLIYYVFGFSLFKKSMLTAMTLAFIIMTLPFQLILHLLLLHVGSVLLMPLMYLVFGLWIQILSAIALYAWAMSWELRM